MIEQVGFLANLIAIYSAFKDPKELVSNLKRLNKKQKLLLILILVLATVIIGLIQALFSGAFTPTITKVVLSDDSLNMTTGDVYGLTVTVLYSDNTESNTVHWVSSNTAVVQVDENGELTALSAGSATITAQASNRKSTWNEECVVTVTDPLKGYSISVQRTAVENYVYIYVQPEDDDITLITLYARAPSGEIYTPSIDSNNLYHFYAEAGIWTIYAELKSQNGIYEARKPEDFVTIEIKDVSPNEVDAVRAGLPIY